MLVWILIWLLLSVTPPATNPGLFEKQEQELWDNFEVDRSCQRRLLLWTKARIVSGNYQTRKWSRHLDLVKVTDSCFCPHFPPDWDLIRLLLVEQPITGCPPQKLPPCSPSFRGTHVFPRKYRTSSALRYKHPVLSKANFHLGDGLGIKIPSLSDRAVNHIIIGTT